GYLVAVNHVKVQVFIENGFLRFPGNMVPDLLRPVRAVQQEDRSWRSVLENVIAFQEIELVARYEIRLIDEIGGIDGAWPKAQVRDGNCAGFLGVVYDVALSVILSFLANNLNRVLVGLYRSVRAQAEEDRSDRVLIFNGEIRI